MTRRYVTYSAGAELYSMSERQFRELLLDAGISPIKVGRVCLIDIDAFDKYIQGFKV